MEDSESVEVRKKITEIEDELKVIKEVILKMLTLMHYQKHIIGKLITQDSAVYDDSFLLVGPILMSYPMNELRRKIIGETK